ncbi:TetR/AcrR family transcriptional regulator [Streptomyces malaysiensis]|uniref:Tetracyclin repressor-like C-terminal domain-containing protein n=1 Tax=Streptomyces malaysiensis subsp. samsunensis TaxID=459658 RepID=A0A9X2M1I1_STRMQ|nr:hypothetical protein [Streptomyces samsunensis]MCQ8833627.1 hypothetical protein [Streptomyces samsunensis]
MAAVRGERAPGAVPADVRQRAPTGREGRPLPGGGPGGDPGLHLLRRRRSTLGSRLAASIVQRWFGAPGQDPLLVLQRASGERPEAAEALAAFLDTNSLEPLHRYLRDSGLDDTEARSRAAAIDAFVLGVSTRRRVLRSELGDPADLQTWLRTTIQRLADG